MIIAAVLIPVICLLCVGGYFLVGRYSKFVNRTKQDKRNAAKSKRRDK